MEIKNTDYGSIYIAPDLQNIKRDLVITNWVNLIVLYIPDI